MSLNVVGAFMPCPKCNKSFVCYTSTWKYKRVVNKHIKYYCSYTCYKKAESTSDNGKSV